jgi:hypothetical protein
MLRRARDETRLAEALLVAALIIGMTAGEIVVPLLWSSRAFAGGNSGGGSNAGSNANGNGNAGGNGDGGGNANAGGNPGAKSNAGGNGKSQTKGAAPGEAVPEIATPNSALGLLESGRIQSLTEVYRVAEQQFGGEIIAATLVSHGKKGWIYDLRIVTEDGYVRNVAYDASTLTLTSMIDDPAE